MNAASYHYTQAQEDRFEARASQIEQLVCDSIEASDTEWLDDEQAETRDQYGKRAWPEPHRLLPLKPQAMEGFATRPVGALVAEICAKVGLKPNWSRWAGEDWAIAEIRDRPKGSPYADWPVAAEETATGPPG